MQLIVQLLIT